MTQDDDTGYMNLKIIYNYSQIWLHGWITAGYGYIVLVMSIGELLAAEILLLSFAGLRHHRHKAVEFIRLNIFVFYLADVVAAWADPIHCRPIVLRRSPKVGKA